MKPVVWSRRATRSFSSQITYIRQHSPKSAERMASKILASASQLADQPLLGPVHKGRIRKLVIAGPPFVALYRVYRDRVEIDWFWNAKQNWLRD